MALKAGPKLMAIERQLDEGRSPEQIAQQLETQAEAVKLLSLWRKSGPEADE
jgi:hypothetical protein